MAIIGPSLSSAWPGRSGTTPSGRRRYRRHRHPLVRAGPVTPDPDRMLTRCDLETTAEAGIVNDAGSPGAGRRPRFVRLRRAVRATSWLALAAVLGVAVAL